MSVLDEGLGMKKKISREQRQILNAALAQQWAKERFHEKSAPVTLVDILRMHRMNTEQSAFTTTSPEGYGGTT